MGDRTLDFPHPRETLPLHFSESLRVKRYAIFFSLACFMDGRKQRKERAMVIYIEMQSKFWRTKCRKMKGNWEEIATCEPPSLLHPRRTLPDNPPDTFSPPDQLEEAKLLSTHFQTGGGGQRDGGHRSAR